MLNVLKTMKKTTRVVWPVAAVAVCLGATPGEPLGPLEPEVGGLIGLPHYTAPELNELDLETVFAPRLKPLWLAAMARPEADDRRGAALAFGEAYTQGMPDLADVPPKLDELLRSDPERLVRLAAARALVQFDHAAAAGTLLAQSEQASTADMVLLTDPALAAWDHAPARAVWLRRLTDAEALQTVRASAMRSLGTVKEPKAVEPLLSYATDAAAPPMLRLEAARALGQIATADLVDEAAALAEGTLVDRLAAASMLASHTDEQAITLLQQLGQGEDPTVASTALAILNSIDPMLVVPVAETLLDRADPNVRYQAVVAVAALRNSEAVPVLARMLNDPSVAVRTLARQELIGYDAEPALSSTVRQAATEVLASDQWRALEQAALIVGKLDHKPAADRLLQRLSFGQPSVRLAVADALRELAVPETLPALHERVQQLTDEASGAGLTPDAREAIGEETTQLMLALGQMGYQPADPLMRKYIPKSSPFTSSARGAAIWSLGLLHEGTPDPALVSAFKSRLSDMNPMAPESNEVRRFSAVGLGRMGAKDSLDTLRYFFDMEAAVADIGGACSWAIARITGEAPPAPEVAPPNSTGWFLEPIE